MAAYIKYNDEIPQIEDRKANEKPDSYLIKEGDKLVVNKGRRPSKIFLVDGIRKDVDKWRGKGYPGISDITKQLLNFWFEQDHLLKGELFYYYFGQQEAVETLIFLMEHKGFRDLTEVITEYAPTFQKLFEVKAEINITPDGKRLVSRYFPELEQEGTQELPEENLLRYAIKMATGSGKTIVMALIIVWSFFHKLKVKNSRLVNNFLVIAPNIIVFERLELDFGSGKIFNEMPLIPPSLKSEWNLNIILRGECKSIYPNGNLFLTNIQQIYESREKEWTPQNVIESILGRKPQKDLSISSISFLEQIKTLDNLMILNDEAHHVHDDTLEWNKTLLTLHHTIQGGLSLWLDFSATPKNQNGTYFPWIIVDYPLAQAVEDKIVKAPLIVHRIDHPDPDNVTKNNVIQAYGDWINAAIVRWKEHFEVYSQVGKKPVLFIMAENNLIADEIAKFIAQFPDIRENEILLIHTDSTGEITKKDIEKAREIARNIDKPFNKIKIVVSVLMLREGWDVQNVTVVLGLRPFTSKAKILPEQGVGRGLRLMRGISPDRIQTLEVIGTSAFEDFVKQLEKEGVGISTMNEPPPLPIIVAPIKNKLDYDIEIPTSELSYSHNYYNLLEIDPLSIESLFNSANLSEQEKIKLRMEFAHTGTKVHEVEIKPTYIHLSQEILANLTNNIIKQAKLTSNYFSDLYSLVKVYLSKKCFETDIDLDNENIRIKLRDLKIQNLIVNLFAKIVGNATVEKKEIKIQSSKIILSKTKEFTWRRKHLKCNHTIFNFVAVFNDFEANFAQFLNDAEDIVKFAAFAETYTGFKIDYLSSRGAIRFYFPDFVAVQKYNNGIIHWIIETKGREFEDVDKKDAAMKKWCEDITRKIRENWQYLKVPQKDFESSNFNSFQELVENLTKPKPKQTKLEQEKKA